MKRRVNVEKFRMLEAQHQALLERFRTPQRLAAEAVAEARRCLELSRGPNFGADAGAFLRQPWQSIATTAPADLERMGVLPDVFARAMSAFRRADAMRRDADAVAPQVKAASALMQNLHDYMKGVPQ